MFALLVLLSQRQDPSWNESYNLIKRCKCVEYFWWIVDELLCMIYLSPKLPTWCMGYTKRNKRCIPKEGMPHAHKACQKKRKDAYPKKVCHTPTRCVKKRERKRKYSPYQKHYKGKRIHIKEFSSIIHQKYPHTCTSWSRLMTCFSFGSGLWLSKIWEASLPSYPPYLQIHQKEEAIRSRMEKERRIKRPWWRMKHIERSERSPEELTNFFSKTL